MKSKFVLFLCNSCFFLSAQTIIFFIIKVCAGKKVLFLNGCALIIFLAYSNFKPLNNTILFT
jgi:hypothetical protein